MTRRAKHCQSCANRDRSLNHNPLKTRTMAEMYENKYGKGWKKVKALHDNQRSITAKERGVNRGKKNGMKQLSARRKVSISRRNMSEKNRRIYSESTRNAWASGKFDDVRVGQCKWHDYILPTGKIVKVQGTWELKFIEWLVNNNFTFTVHKGRIPYNINGQQKNYYPDFYVSEWNCYVDVKNDYHYNLQREKFNAIRSCNPDIEIRILTKCDLIQLGLLL